jgi:hypothetical protein
MDPLPCEKTLIPLRSRAITSTNDFRFIVLLVLISFCHSRVEYLEYMAGGAILKPAEIDSPADLSAFLVRAIP